MKHLRLYFRLYKSPRSAFVTLCLTLLALMVVTGVINAAVGTVRDIVTAVSTSRQDKAADAQDERREENVNAALTPAAGHETNANQLSTDRQVNEERARGAQARKDEAALNSNRTLEPTLKARRRYEETRRNNSLDPVAPLSDADLCAELVKRRIPCR
ncbi:MAG: hypothetical protein H0T60_08035 [Acidobacteria bacterium]|nr:hypothetical protein [Acidobacteriota bacterium]